MAFSLCVACQSAPADPSRQVVKAYYPSGQLHRTAVVENGQAYGPVVWYYRNGARKEVARFVRGRAVGSRVLFDSTGKSRERHVYEATGRMFYIQGYDPQGRPKSGGLLPLLDAPDTIPFGQPYSGSVRFGYALNKPAVLLVGTFTHPAGIDQSVMVDTFQRVTQSPDGRFYFSYRPPRPGRNTFAYRFLQPAARYEPTVVGSREEDSLGIDYLTSNHPFYVK